MSLDGFWAAIDAQLEELKSAKSADDVMRILAAERNPDPYNESKRAFFAGSGGDGTVMDSLLDAGWRVTWSEASYYYTMQAPDGSKITYIEGDIEKGETHA